MFNLNSRLNQYVMKILGTAYACTTDTDLLRHKALKLVYRRSGYDHYPYPRLLFLRHFPLLCWRFSYYFACLYIITFYQRRMITVVF